MKQILEVMKLQNESQIEILQAQLNAANAFTTALNRALLEIKGAAKRQAPIEDTEDTDEEETTPAPKAKAAPKKPAKPSASKSSSGDEELEASVGEGSEDADLNDYLGEPETAPTHDDIRVLLRTITTKKGEAGVKAAKQVLAKHTKGGSGQVKDVTDIAKVLSALKKI